MRLINFLTQKVKLKKFSIIFIFLIFNLTKNQNTILASSFRTSLRKSILIIKGPASDGSAVVVGKNGNSYTVLTAKHVLGTKNDTHDILLPSGQIHKLIILKTFNKEDLAIASFQTKEDLYILPINALLPYPAPNTAEENEYAQLELKSEFNTIDYVARVSGYSLPTNAVKTNLFRVIDASLIAQAKNNKDGYDLLYQASTVKGMSGGAVVGFRDCEDNQQGFTFTLSPIFNFPTLVGIHGRSEDYHGDGRSGISLGIPIKGKIKNFLINKKDELGIPSGELEIRSTVNKQYCKGSIFY